MLAIWQLRGLGITYAAGISSVAALALAIPVGLLIIFLGFSTPQQRVDTFTLAGYMLAMLVVAISAWVAHFRLPRDQRRSGVVALCAIGAGLYILFGWGFSQSATHRPYDRATSIREHNDRQARNFSHEKNLSPGRQSIDAGANGAGQAPKRPTLFLEAARRPVRGEERNF
jgi:hypothetical protein